MTLPYLFGLIDEAFETAGQTEGTVAVALNVSVTYVSSPKPGKRLRADPLFFKSPGAILIFSHGNTLAF